MNPGRFRLYRLRGERRLASGHLAEVALAVRRRSTRRPDSRSSSSTMPPAGRSISIFAAPTTTSWRGCRDPRRTRRPRPRGTLPPEPRGPRPAETRRGRARGHAAAAALGMAGAQPGGASVALRKLVDEARRANGDTDRQPRGARRRLSFHVGHGRQSAGFRRSVARAVRRRPAAVCRADRRLARRYPRPHRQTRLQRSRRTAEPTGRSG